MSRLILHELLLEGLMFDEQAVWREAFMAHRLEVIESQVQLLWDQLLQCIYLYVAQRCIIVK